MMLDANEEDALLQLRREMLEFVIEELALRAARGSAPALSKAMAEQLETHINASVTQAMSTARRSEAADIASYIIQQLYDHDGSGRAAGDENQPGGNRNWRTGLPARLGDTRATPIIVILSLILLVALVVVTSLYVEKIDKSARSAVAAVEAEQNYNLFMQGVCDRDRQVRDQLRGLAETRSYTNQCTADGANQNAMCVTFFRIQQLSDSRQCAAWRASR